MRERLAALWATARALTGPARVALDLTLMCAALTVALTVVYVAQVIAGNA